MAESGRPISRPASSNPYRLGDQVANSAGSLYMERSFGPHGSAREMGNPLPPVTGLTPARIEEAVREHVDERLQVTSWEMAPPGAHSRPCINRRCARHCAKLHGLSSCRRYGLYSRAHVGWLAWAWGLPPREKWKHGNS